MEIHKFDSIPSTNSALLELSKKNAKAWTVFWTTNQTNGRGYSGNQWEANKDENLAFSVLIKSDLSYQELIFFNQWVSNVVRTVISKYLSPVHVKWPNDIIACGKKIAGILIETNKVDNQLNIVLGVGVNVNQMDFGEISKAGSLASISHKKYSIKEILSDLLTEFKSNFESIEDRNWSAVAKEYHSNLFRLDEKSFFKKENQEIEGIIRGVDENGQLIVEIDTNTILKFQHKEIELIY